MLNRTQMLGVTVLCLTFVFPTSLWAQKWFSRNRATKVVKKKEKADKSSIAGMKRLKKFIPKDIPKDCKLKPYRKGDRAFYKAQSNPYVSSDSSFRDVIARTMVPNYKQVKASLFLVYQKSGKEAGVFGFYYDLAMAKLSIKELKRIMRPSWNTTAVYGKHTIFLVWTNDKKAKTCYAHLIKHTRKLTQQK